MPISEDEFEFRTAQNPQNNMSKAELRKTHKPIMEKRRRARINQCLNEIKTLILEAMNKDPARHSKLEKADILEMAVKHLQNVQRQQLAMAMASDPSVLRKFKSGFNECATEIDEYINRLQGIETGIKERISSHLQKCIGGIEQVAHFNFPGFSNLPFMTAGQNIFVAASTSTVDGDQPYVSGDQNNNGGGGIQIPQGIQLIPSRLPSGELALLVPNSSNLQYFPTLTQQTQRPSAFATVIPSSSSFDSNKSSAVAATVGSNNLNISPRGFRPVIPSNAKTFSSVAGDPQVAQVSSTSLGSSSGKVEVKTIKFPIHNYSEKERKVVSPVKKVIEPLCIITNQSERYKQAQMRDDSVNFEENRLRKGVKREFSETVQPQGLLAVACTAEDYSCSTSKVRNVEQSKDDRQVAPPSRDNNDSSDMWRPW